MAISRFLLKSLIALALVVTVAFCADGVYEAKEQVPVYVNVIGPHDNPSETYEYYTLPWCLPPDAVHKHLGLGESLEGDRDVMINSLYDIRFRTDVEKQPLCTKELAVADSQEFERAIEQDYYFQMTIDDLPVWGFVGKQEIETDSTGRETVHMYLFTHLLFTISYNGDRVIEVNVVAQRSELKRGAPNTFDFTYSVKWTPTDVPYEQRMERYTDNALFARDVEIHWLSILNSAVLAVLLCGFIAVILTRILRADCAGGAGAALDLEEGDDVDAAEEDSGWKAVHGYVFRPPTNLTLFAAVLGNGAQIGAIVMCTLILGAAGFIYPYSRGTLYSAAIFLFAITACVNGYVSGSMYKKLDGQRWVRNTIVTVLLLFGPTFVVWAFLNSVAWAYGSAQALPPSTVALLLVIYVLVEFPLVVIGAIAGRHFAGPFEAPCRNLLRPRDIPAQPWYRSQPAQLLTAGLLPFCCIYIELYYIFSAVWGRMPYTLYNMLLVAAIIVLVVTACVTIALVYFQLAAEDYRWWWRSIAFGGSTMLFVFAYAVYYYLTSGMHGFMQITFYFGYVALVCYALFLFLGSVGFASSLVFVKQIYSVMKTD